MQANLSLEQAPPISVPFRFFLTAPLFGVAAGLLILFIGPDIFLSRWAPATLALTHLITLGFMGLVMCGAIMQMLPVIAGAVIERPVLNSGIIHLVLTVGIGALAAGLSTSSSSLLVVAMVALGFGFAIFITAVFYALLRSPANSTTVYGMQLAIIALLITVALGLLLLSAFIWAIPEIDISRLTNVHLAWGILGWVGLLLVNAAYQVVPMFQLTPRYPQWMTRRLSLFLFGGLLLWSGLYGLRPFSSDLAAHIWLFLCLAGFAVFAGVTLMLQRRRKRRTEDVTVWFWRLALYSVLFGILLWSIDTAFPSLKPCGRLYFLLGVCLLVGFAASVISGMLYKIVPFLIWFHLQQRRISKALDRSVTVPNVKRILPARAMKRQFAAHLCTVILLALSTLEPEWLTYPAGGAMVISFAMLWYNIGRATWIYVEYDRYFRQSVDEDRHS